MEVKYLDLELKEELALGCACIGYFDGLHLGHQELIKKVKQRSAYYNLPSILISFNPDPLDVIKGIEHQHIHSNDIRLELLGELGLDYVYFLNFNARMMKLSKQDFVTYLTSLNLKSLVCGYDYHYSYQGQGDYASLKKDSPFEVLCVEQFSIEDEKVSSTRIKKALREGDILMANKLLGYSFYVEGEVIYGKQNGRTINFPTANIKIDQEQLLPSF